MIEDTAPDQIYVLGPGLIAEHDEFRKEIRALAPELIVESLRSWPGVADVTVVEAADLRTLTDEHEVILPDEAVSQEVARSYIAGTARFHPLFLRWDREKALAESDVHAAGSVSESELDQRMLAAADAAAQASSDWWRRVGAILTKDDEIVISATNQHVPSPHQPWTDGDPRNSFKRGIAVEFGTSIHAEARIIVEAARQGISLEGAKLYATVFPCQHCAKLIAYSGISELYYRTGYSVLDGEKVLKAKQVRIIQVAGEAAQGSDEAWVPYPEKPSRPGT